MNRRSLLKSAGATAVVAVIGTPLTLIQFGCGSTKQLAKWTATFIAASKEIIPLLIDMGAGQIVPHLERAVVIAGKLKKAFEDNDNASALTFLNNLINPVDGVVVQIATLIGLLNDDAKKRLVQGAFTIGMIALRLIAAHLEDTVPQSDVATAELAQPKAVGALRRAAKPGALQAAFDAAKF